MDAGTAPGGEGTTPTYSRSFRAIEVASITAFFGLSSVIAWRLAPHVPAHPWLLGSAFFAGFLAADFVSGFVHWLGDTWGSSSMPVIGEALVRPFREHHVDPRGITRHDYIETNGANCLLAVPVALVAACVPFELGAWKELALFAVAATGSMIFWVMMTNQFHKWAHNTDDERPRCVSWLQRRGLILSPEHHAIHHRAPYATHYNITTGWLNGILWRVDFYRRAEALVHATTGLVPRGDETSPDYDPAMMGVRPARILEAQAIDTAAASDTAS